MKRKTIGLIGLFVSATTMICALIGYIEAPEWAKYCLLAFIGREIVDYLANKV